MAEEKNRQIRKPFLDLQEASVNIMNHTFPTGIISKVAGDIGTFSMPLHIHTANHITLLRHILKKVTIFSDMPLHPVENKKNPFLFKAFLLPQNIINFPKPVAGFPFPLSSFHPSPFAFYRPSQKLHIDLHENLLSGFLIFPIISCFPQEIQEKSILSLYNFYNFFQRKKGAVIKWKRINKFWRHRSSWGHALANLAS